MQFEPMVIITISYLLTIAILVQVMKNRQPFKLTTLALLHNINLVCLSVYMFCEILHQCYLHSYSIWGNQLDRSEGGTAMASVIWLFYVSKVPEFLDTIMMALKKNNHQITFLHVYHHASIFVLWWIICYYTPGGDAYFSAMLNSFVHIVMYSYYLWSTFAPKLKEGQRSHFLHPSFYRRYITLLQLTQFVLMFSQATHGLFYPSPIPFSDFFAWMLFLYMCTMLTLFGNFFYQQYSSGGKKSKKAKTLDSENNNNNNSTMSNNGVTGTTYKEKKNTISLQSKCFFAFFFWIFSSSIYYYMASMCSYYYLEYLE